MRNTSCVTGDSLVIHQTHIKNANCRITICRKHKIYSHGEIETRTFSEVIFLNHLAIRAVITKIQVIKEVSISSFGDRHGYNNRVSQ